MWICVIFLGLFLSFSASLVSAKELIDYDLQDVWVLDESNVLGMPSIDLVPEDNEENEFSEYGPIEI